MTAYRHRRATVTALTTAVLVAALASCSSASSGTSDDHPKGPGEAQQVTTVAKDYLHAWMAVSPADHKTMCELKTKAARPNFGQDGGTLDGCITASKDGAAGKDDNAGRAPLDITVDHVQDVTASRKHPAGKGALATLHRDGEEPFRYAMRLIKEDGHWRVEQTTDVGDNYRHSDDPVAGVLENMG
ncbi:hypothetical protein AB0H73_09220 [Streptomyces olivoreticuli]